MIRSTLLPALLAVGALPLAACGETNVANDQASITVPEGDYAARLRGMSDAERNATLFRAIDDAGRPCQQVTASSALAEMEGQPAWEATCQSGARYTIVLGRDGTASVIDPSEAQAAQPNPGD